MDLGLKGKTALVSGSSRGIGLAVAKALKGEGCRVAINGRDAATLEKAKSDIQADVAVRGDVGDPHEAKRVFEETLAAFSQLDILVCNVGGGRSVPPGEEDFDEWQRVFAINLWSATNMVELAKDELARAKGAVVCTSSICGHESLPGAPVTYSTAKAALESYVKGVSRPLGRLGVRINSVAPGNILFDGSVWWERQDDPKVKEMLDKEVALSRFGTPEEIASVVAFMASPKAAFVTGASWVADGGQVR